MVPDAWSLCTFQEVCEKITDGTHFSPKARPSGVLYITSKNIRPFRLDLTNPVYISEADHKEIYSRCDVKKGDVLLTKDGASTGNAVVNPLHEEFSLLSSVAILRTDKRVMLPGFLCQFLNSPQGQYQSVHSMDGLAIKRLTVVKIKGLVVPTPPLVEQDRIVEILTTWDRAIEQVSKLIDAKTRLKKGLMQQLLTGKRRFPGFEEQGWRSVKLGDVFKERREADRVDLPLLSVTSDRGVIDRNEVDRKDTSTKDKSSYKRIAPGDIGYNTMRMWQGVSGLSDLEGIVSPAYTIVTPRPGINGQFVAHLFKLPEMIHRFHRYSQGLVSDTLNLKYRHFAQVKARIPALSEQRRIAFVLETANKSIIDLSTYRERIETQKRALMQVLLTGKVRVSAGREERA